MLALVPNSVAIEVDNAIALPTRAFDFRDPIPLFHSTDTLFEIQLHPVAKEIRLKDPPIIKLPTTSSGFNFSPSAHK